MTHRINALGQAIGLPIDDWQARHRPPNTPMFGRFCRVEVFSIERHAADLFQAFSADESGANWTYLPSDPPVTEHAFHQWLKQTCLSEDPYFHVVVDLATERAVGMAALMRMHPEMGVIEVGHIHFSPLMQRTPLSTEALYLMMKRVFDELGYRRYEWKCDALNQPSRSTAERLGFTYEGTFRQAMVVKGRNRDTAWFSILDSEWPAQKAAFEQWLDPNNFADNGTQRRSLAECRAD